MGVQNIVVIGAGQMGSGIAQVCAMAGYDVKVQDLKQEQLDRGLAIITKNLARQVEKGRMKEEEKEATLNRLTVTLDLDCVKEADLIIEATVEKMDIKKKIFANLDEIARTRNFSNEYVISANYRNCGGNEASGKSNRYALYESSSSYEAC